MPLHRAPRGRGRVASCESPAIDRVDVASGITRGVRDLSTSIRIRLAADAGRCWMRSQASPYGNPAVTARCGTRRVMIVMAPSSSTAATLSYTSHAGGTANVLCLIARDAFMGSDDKRNLAIFRRDRQGLVGGVDRAAPFQRLRLERKA